MKKKKKILVIGTAVLVLSIGATAAIVLQKNGEFKTLQEDLPDNTPDDGDEGTNTAEPMPEENEDVELTESLDSEDTATNEESSLEAPEDPLITENNGTEFLPDEDPEEVEPLKNGTHPIQRAYLERISNQKEKWEELTEEQQQEVLDTTMKVIDHDDVLADMYAQAGLLGNQGPHFLCEELKAFCEYYGIDADTAEYIQTGTLPEDSLADATFYLRLNDADATILRAEFRDSEWTKLHDWHDTFYTYTEFYVSELPDEEAAAETENTETEEEQEEEVDALPPIFE